MMHCEYLEWGICHSPELNNYQIVSLVIANGKNTNYNGPWNTSSLEFQEKSDNEGP